MTEHTPPEPIVAATSRWLPSLVWAVPLIAALIGLSLAVQAVLRQGPTIKVSFSTGEGIVAGKTKVKYKNVDIGEVKEMHLSDDRKRVVAVIDLDKSASVFATADSRFWVVRPRLGVTTVSGLSTLFSGSYIGVDGGRSDERRDSFVGLEQPPVIASDEPGRRFLLHADDIGSLDAGSPVYFRRVQVGHVESFSVDADGHHITLPIFVKAPYDRFVTPDTHFWHASGIDLSFNASGLKLQTQSLATILLGGIAFDSPSGDANPAQEGNEYTLAANRAEAVKTPDGDPQTVVLQFSESVRGLSPGAPIDFRGVPIGEVESVNIAYDAKTDSYSAPVTAVVYPKRLNLPESALGNPKTRVEELVRKGLRAQLRTGSLLTGQLYVALDFFPDAKPAHAASLKDGRIELPTIPGDLQELQAQIRDIMKKVEKIPFDTIGQDVHRTLVTLDATLKRLDTLSATAEKDVLPQIRDSLRAIGETLATTQSMMGGDSPLQQDTRAALRGVTEAARSLKALADGIDRRPESLIRGKKDETP